MGKIIDILVKQPLFMPKGSVRALLAIAIVGSAVYGSLVGIYSVEQSLTISGIVTAFYFALKNKEE